MPSFSPNRRRRQRRYGERLCRLFFAASLGHYMYFRPSSSASKLCSMGLLVKQTQNNDALPTKQHSTLHAPPQDKKCFRLGIDKFQVYHLSKCGGTNLRFALQAVFHAAEPARFKRVGWWEAERENYPDPRYRRDPSSAIKQQTFVLGIVRNPFGYYRSLFGMNVGGAYQPCIDYLKGDSKRKEEAPWCPCGFRRAYQHGLLGLFHESNRNNISAFAQWLEFIFTDVWTGFRGGDQINASSSCYEALQHRYNNLMTMSDGSMAYDDVVRQDDYYPSLREALRKVSPCAPPNVTIDIEALDIYEANVPLKGSRHYFSRSAGNETSFAKALPDYCFYPPQLRRLVEESDAEYMRRYNYSWESFLGEGSYEKDCLRPAFIT